MIIALTMWIATIILGIADYKTESTRWAMGLTFFAGLAVFGVFWSGSTWMPAYVASFGITKETYRIISSIFSGLSHHFIPYFALMFGLNYSGILNEKYQKILSILLLVPMGITFLFFPTHDYYFNTYKEISYYYWFFSVWAVPYSLISCILQIYAYRKEDIPSKKRERFIFCLIAVPGIAVNSITTYLLAGLPVGETWKFWRYNFFVIVYMFILFLYFLVKYGVLGIKLRFEKQNLRNMMNVMDSGIKILSHSLKNEITNISICMTNLKLSLVNPDKDNDVWMRENNENFQMVATSLAHLSNMMKKLQKNSIDPGIFKLTKNNLSEIIETALEYVVVSLKSKNILIDKNVDRNISILSDKVYLQEVFVNLFQNAIEAMNCDGGKLTVETNLTKEGLTIVVKDNGVGINKEDLLHVIEPFFTTKDTRNNFGLGLSYCYNILKKHGASFEVESKVNNGTTVSLYFPKNKFILTAMNESIEDYYLDYKG